MASHCYVMNIAPAPANPTYDGKSPPKDKALYYEEKAVGSTSFYKCQACPYMALAEDDIKYHLFTVHPDLAKSYGLSDVKIPCPGCTEVFDAENTLRTHLRAHHKMGIRDVRKMAKSLIQIALKNTKKESLETNILTQTVPPAPPPEVKIPQVIEIVPDIVQSNNAMLPNNVTIISVDELQKMSTPNFEQVDPKELIQEASINIVYNGELPSNYTTSNKSDSTLQNSTPDLLSSIQPTTTQSIYLNSSENSTVTHTPGNSKDSERDCIYSGPVKNKQSLLPESFNVKKLKKIQKKVKESGTQCSISNCGVRLISEKKLAYHVTCHQNGKLQCPECKQYYHYVKQLHTHLWKAHEIDMELNSCDLCEYKTYSLSRLNNIHRKIHSKRKEHPCPICGKLFRSLHSIGTHKATVHSKTKSCSVCLKSFNTQRQLTRHMQAVHENKKLFQCSDCDYATVRKCTLKVHIRTHTGVEPYKCNHCSFSTVDHNSLRKHKLQHSNQKKYICKHCPYTAIQSLTFIKHMTKKHPDIQSDDIFPCPYCNYKSVSRDKFLNHLRTHNNEKEGIQRFVMNNGQQTNWTTPSKEQPKNIWNPPTENEATANWNTSTENQSKTNWNTPRESEPISKWNQPTENQHCESMKTDLIELPACEQQSVDCAGSETPSDITISIEVEDCDSENDIMNNKNYPNKYSYLQTSVGMNGDKTFQEILTDFSKDDNNSDCIISESSNDTVNERHQCFPQHSMQNVTYTGNNMHGSNLHNFLGTAVTIGDNLLQNSNVNVITSNNSFTSNSMSTNIMNNFPIYLPSNPRLSIRTNHTLTPSDKIPLPVPKAIIKPSQILAVPSCSNSPVGQSTSNQPACQENEGAPKKKAKISVKSNLILKGPDQINMFHSEPNLVFARMQDSERLNLSSPVTFNNLITTCMQLPPEPVLSNNPEDLSAIPPYTPEPMLVDPNIPQVKDSRQLFTFNRQIDMNSMNMLSQEQNKMFIISGNPSFIKLESKQNIQSPSLERMCKAESMIKTQEISDEYCKATALLEDMQKSVNEIKNEIKSDTFFNMTMNSSQNPPTVMDRHMIDTIIGANEIYGGHLDLSGVVMPEITEEGEESDVIEIDDNSEDNKLIQHRYDLNYPLEYIHNDFCFLDSELAQPCSSGMSMPQDQTNELNNMSAEMPLIHQNVEPDNCSENQETFEKFIHGRKDPMMNTSVRPAVNKINVKSIESMKN